MFNYKTKPDFYTILSILNVLYPVGLDEDNNDFYTILSILNEVYIKGMGFIIFISIQYCLF